MAGAVRIGRAAAFLALATGVNGILALYYPRYEPIYAYLAAVVVVATLGSALLGVTTAIAAVIIYDWMFSPVPVVPAASSVIPLTVAILAALSAWTARTRLVRRAPLPAPAPLPLLPPVPDLETAEKERAFAVTVEDLEGRVQEAHAATDRESRLRTDAAATARLRERYLEQELELLRNRGTELATGRASERRELDAARQRLSEAEARTAALHQEIDVAYRKADEAEGRVQAERSLREQLEISDAAAVEKTVGGLTAGYEAAQTELQQKLADAEASIHSYEARLTGAHEHLTEALRARDEESSRAQQEGARRQQLELAARETLQRTADVSAEHQRKAAEALARAEQADTLLAETSRILNGEVDAARAEIAGLEAELERVRTAAVAAGEASRDDLASAIARGQLLEQEINRVRAILHAETQRADRESELREQLEERARGLEETAQQLDETTRQLSDAEHRADQQRARQEATAAEFDQNLQRIVAGITTDYEHSLGEAMVDREAARAELREASKRLQDLQRRVLEFDGVYTEAQRLIGELKRSLDEERAARSRAEGEWNEKLQSIVTHLAGDHEADLGEAMLEKEGARAETRNAQMKLTAALQKLEGERERYRLAVEQWHAEREQLVLKASSASQEPPDAPPFGALVLVVHSDAGVRAMSRHSLEKAGYQVLTAGDGLEGLRSATANRPDVVLAESVMPKMNGRELVQLLKSRAETSGVKIILINSSRGEERERGSDFRADDFVTNASDLDQMHAALANVLGRQVP